ncbi:hypothetical protein ANO14919_131280 [Xylariales sp. No.14919]|nr:hypothetical protein ANO14919_131280 [Xylariales sp. No.14919]
MASLHIAVLFGNEQMTRTLLEEGYDANVYDERLGTPLSIAVLKGYRSIVKLLSDHGADHNHEGFTSALIHPRIDEFNLPDHISTFAPDDDSKAQTGASKPQGHSRSLLHARRPIVYDSGTGGSLSDDSESGSMSGTGPGVSIGSKSEVKSLFKKGSQWKKAPFSEHISQELVQSAHEAYAVVRYMNRNDEGGWGISKIRIHGSKLCGFLSRVLEAYPRVGLGHTRTTLYPTMTETLCPNFVGLFHEMERCIKLSEEETDPVTKKQVSLLLQILKPQWSSVRNDVEECRATGLIKWANLWMIYRPGDIAILRTGGGDGNAQSAARIVKLDVLSKRWDRPPSYEVTLKLVDWNGSYTGYKEGTCNIPMYDGLKSLADIGICPLSHDPDPEKLRERLVQRGRRFESLRGYFFMTREDFNVTRRVIIDNYAYHRFQGYRIPTYARLGGRSSADNYSPDSEDDFQAAIQGLSLSPSHTGKGRSLHSERKEDLRPLTNEECLLCVPTMKGFDVQEKEWQDIQVGKLESIAWNDEAFSHLAIQEDRKRLILAFTKQKQNEGIEFDDFITGKGEFNKIRVDKYFRILAFNNTIGKSFIILLCGPPGVGKRLTAESVAERTRAPLYTVSASDLGTSAGSVEAALKKALDMCALWRAVMLIDEADVFLEARKTDSLERNELVSVFLRLLEYYKGILFLTTNRVATIDTAFESRIDLIIPYDDFDEAARRQVWVSFANSLVGGAHQLCEADFKELSEQKLNGREIKSTVKTGLMLAKSEGKTLQMEHLRIVLGVRQRAAEYLHGEAAEGGRVSGMAAEAP